jgi:uncharacterized protein YkwD
MKPLMLLLALVTVLCAQDAAEANMQHIRMAATWLGSVEPPKRKAAVSTFRTMPASALPQYRVALEAARKVHEKRIDEIGSGNNALTAHDELARQLTEERKRVMPLIHTDYRKDNRKVQMLRNEMQSLGSLHEKRNHQAKASFNSLAETYNDALNALCDIARELHKLDPQKDAQKPNDEELRAQIIADSFEANHVKNMLSSWENTMAEMKLFAEVEAHNAEHGAWCSASMKTFATTLNRERAVLGLGSLRVEEKLSDAASGHSKDMASVGFFAHESPVPNKKSPMDRASRAQFKGGFRGENIFMGSADAQAAFDAWFASDGHRFIMFAAGPDCCGIGVSGIHWTLMTGKL